MDALVARCAVLVAAVLSLGASYRTPNFIIEAPTADAAEKIGRAAEAYRRQLAVDWTGQEMANWSRPCPITAQVADHLGAGGATSFVFEHGEVFDWRMTIQGSLVRILDSVLPHEVTHTIFATHFRQPLPRWADEGACTTVEHPSEKAKQQTMLIGFLQNRRGIAFSKMFAMREYPHDIMPLYSQGYSVARFLVAQGGRRKFLAYIADGLRDENWARATKTHYGFDNLLALQTNWLDWVRKGSPNLESTTDTPPLVAVKDRNRAPGPAEAQPARPDSNLIASLDNRPTGGPDGPSVYDAASNSGALAKPSASKRDDSWHPRGSAAAQLATAKNRPLEPAEPASTRPSGPQHQVTRPQEIQRPRQVILEWNRPPGSDSASVGGPLPGPL